MSEKIDRPDGWVHPLFEEVNGVSLSEGGFVSEDSLHMLVDFSQSERVSAVEKAIRRRIDPEKDMELLHWFRLLKRVYALGIIGDGSKCAEYAEKQLVEVSFPKRMEDHVLSAGRQYRACLKRFYTELPDTGGIEGNTYVFALPKTKVWILSEIADGWNRHVYATEDRLDCLLFLSMAADGAFLASGYPYADAFHAIGGGWREVQKCVRDLLRERAKKYELDQLVSFLRNPHLQETVCESLWHALIAKMMEHRGMCGKLRAMIESVSW